MALSTADHALDGAHATLRVQALGAMLGPLTLRLPDGRQVAPLYRAPWHGEHGCALDDAPLLRHLNGEWLCAPFGPAAAPPDLPPGWQVRALSEGSVDAAHAPGWDHGWIANHAWMLVRREDSSLGFAIEPPVDHVLARVERVIRLSDDAPRVEVVTTLYPRRDAQWPVALHPTFALPRGGVELRPGAFRAAHAYPVAPVSGRSRLQPGGRSASLAALPAVGGGTIDLRRLPLADDTEELVQLQDVRPPFVLRWLPLADAGSSPIDLTLDWDAGPLPDLLLWISQRGRSHAPWNARNVALGIEPCASCFDLTRVAQGPAAHPLAHRHGLSLKAGVPVALRWSLAAHAAPSTA